MAATRAAVVGDVFERWGSHEVAEPLYREGGVRNGPTMKPIERRAGLIEHMTPDMASMVGALGACQSSREVERTLQRTGLVPPGSRVPREARQQTHTGDRR